MIYLIKKLKKIKPKFDENLFLPSEEEGINKPQKLIFY